LPPSVSSIFVSKFIVHLNKWLQKLCLNCRIVAKAYGGKFMNFIIKDDPRAIIDLHIPFTERSKMLQIIVDAYKWSDMLLNNTEAFKIKRSKNLLAPELKNIAVEFFFMQAMLNNNLPFEYRYATNSNRSHSYIEIYNQNILIHINQVARKEACGRKAYCRDRFINDPESYFVIDKEELTINHGPQHYFQLNHGYQSSSPAFISLGIPNNKGKFSAYVPLMEEVRAINGNYPKSELQHVEEFSFEEFQRFAEGEEIHDSKKSL